MSKLKRTERGWGESYFCSTHRCKFRRNTLLEYGDVRVVISTVGLLMPPQVDVLEPVGDTEYDTLNANGAYFETMAFHADPKDTRYHDADISRQIKINQNWQIKEVDADDIANEMHEEIVVEIEARLRRGKL